MIYVVSFKIGGREVISAVFLMLSDAKAFVDADTNETWPYRITEVESWETLQNLKGILAETLGETK